MAGRLQVTFGLFALAFGCPSAAQAGSVEVRASALNVRTGPGTGNRALGAARRGQVYPELERRGAWVRLQWGSRSGWSHGRYLRANAAPVQRVTAGSLNVRSGAGTRFRVLGALGRGVAVSVLGRSGSWRLISFEGRQAYVHGRYLSASQSTSTRPSPSRPAPSRPQGRTSRAGYLQLPASGPGFYSYARQSRRWGQPRMIYAIQRVALRLSRELPGGRMAVGDISFEKGGRISGHRSHRLGVDVDVRPLQKGRGEGATTIFRSNYSHARTQRAIDLFVQEARVKNVFFNDRRTRHTQRWPNHDNHFHVRIR